MAPPSDDRPTEARSITFPSDDRPTEARSITFPSDDRPTEARSITFPGAHRPDRRRQVHTSGVGIAVYEWGDPSAPPLLLVHGGFDFAGTFDVFAPLLAEAGWRVVSFDQRGHGDSEHAALYSWPADLRDYHAVLDSVTSDPLPAIGHSKGGGQLTEMIQALPHRFSHFVNIDGMQTHRPAPDVPDHERTKMLSQTLAAWLDHRRQAAMQQRRPGTIDELARRRGRMNPRLSLDWLRYLVTIGARRDEDGWRWKIDPSLRMGGFGPWRPEWSVERMLAISVPMLGIIGSEEEAMGWGVTADELRPALPRHARVEVVEDTGHFAHIERPRVVADLVLEFLR